MTRSQSIFAAARELFPGGVNSPVRAFAAVGGEPPVMARGDGAYLWDEDGKRHIDFVLGYGPHILGHRPEAVSDAIQKQLQYGMTFGSTTAIEVELGRRITAAMPALEMLRFVSSGTEATMSAIRLARAVTARDVIVKCEGGYHGHADQLLAAAGSGATTLALPDSRGVPAASVRDTVVVPYNDAAAMGAALRDHDVAAVIVEPIAGNMGCVLPQTGYLQDLRRLTRDCGAILIFDEVITGFRVARGGAQELYGVTPDLTCIGKVIGGGLPAAAYGGRRDLMRMMAPEGDVYQAGTLSGNALAMAAGCAVLDALDADAYARLEELGEQLAEGLQQRAQDAGMSVAVNRAGSMVTPFWGVDSVSNFSQARAADGSLFASWHRELMRRGLYWPPSRFETGFLSLAHTDADIDEALELMGESLAVAANSAAALS